ncbi:MAG: hypothetical protein NVSMB56_07840 [Pyrinomonadaceae bacterium]
MRRQKLIQQFIFCVAVIFLTFTAQTRAAIVSNDDAPAWLRQAALIPTPALDVKDVPALVLHDEGMTTVNADGYITMTANFAIRVLTREGREFASAGAFYRTDGDKVREIRAWLIRVNGTVKKYDKNEVADVALNLNDVYNDARIKSIAAERDAEVGDVFGYQYTVERRKLFSQDEWSFQGRRLPVVLSRYTLTLPQGWRATSVTFNHAKIEPSVSGASYTWELRDIPPVEFEPSSPAVTDLEPRLAVNFAPASGASANIKSYETWQDVSRWYTDLSDAQSALDDPIALKVRELTANSKTEFEKIQAVGRYVQNLQYISIQIGIGGYRPHTATQVFAKSYGDCKDKANLMRAMLKAVKIPSYLTLIYSGDPNYVREEFASPSQFNHCIIAVKVSDATKASTVIQHPTLGRLLIFDATDENTPVGDLPIYEQGSFALVAAGDSGALMRMPVTPPEANRIERQADAELAPDGSIKANIHEQAFGQEAKTYRREFRGRPRSEYNALIERWVTRGVPVAKVSKVEPVDNHDEGRFALDVELNAVAYAQLMRDRLLVFKPAIVSRRDALTFTESKRRHSIVLHAQAYNETVRVKLPAGFEVDELPDPLKLETPFGIYITTYTVRDNQLIFTRTLTVRALTVPVEKYNDVRSFFARVRAADQSPVVLLKK